ncbi:KEOPS complex subunit Pcc1 [Halorubrum ezzemoulense]|uniref:KEOPS complex subunit Pcc1 n=1 Tax=Halorubrum ezzemoulense TaxID=337243 RepID=UPI00232B1C5F|nr:KEOPS complex subunit Pcc1 [Halorubrum ezzemoulense]MDB2223780.1 KEOPS complex subunit Pcc1 [Halorubrum ezzemoulense]
MTRAHETVLSFTYPSERRARVVADTLGPEIGEIDDARSTATVDREGDAVRIRVLADDLVALRAGVNSWSRLIAVAERVGTGRD